MTVFQEKYEKYRATRKRLLDAGRATRKDFEARLIAERKALYDARDAQLYDLDYDAYDTEIQGLEDDRWE